MTADPPADPVEVAREIALRRLSLRAHSRAELAQAMQARDVPEDAISEVLDRFSEVGLVDDASFAQEWARSRHQHRGLSRRVVADELRRRGVEPEVVIEATAQIDHDAELEVATAFATKKLRGMARLEPAVAKRRLAGALARRGYGSAVVAHVLREVLRDSAGVDDEGLPQG